MRIESPNFFQKVKFILQELIFIQIRDSCSMLE
jgi:hypothetical protein